MRRPHYFVAVLLTALPAIAFAAGFLVAAAIYVPRLTDARQDARIEAGLKSEYARHLRAAEESLTATADELRAVSEDCDGLLAQLRDERSWKRVNASWYGAECYGNRTADGTRFTPATRCVAHKTLPLGTRVQVRYRGRVVTTTVRDRGPFVAGREFDLSAAVARELGFSGVGVIEWRKL